MRTTLDIDDDVLRAAKELARREHQTAGQVVSRLLRMAFTGRQQDLAPVDDQKNISPSVAGFRPLPTGKQIVTNTDIDALRDAEGL